jgi:hypothetical protein
VRVVPRKAGILYVIAEWQIGISRVDRRDDQLRTAKEIPVASRYPRAYARGT